MVAKDERMRPQFGADALTLTLTGKCSILKHVTQLKKVDDDNTDCVSNIKSNSDIFRNFFNLVLICKKKQKQIAYKYILTDNRYF